MVGHGSPAPKMGLEKRPLPDLEVGLLERRPESSTADSPTDSAEVPETPAVPIAPIAPAPSDPKPKSVILIAIRSDASNAVFGSRYILSAMFATTDPLRREAAFVVEGLQRSGIDVWMITGDNRVTASAVASQVGIAQSRVIAGVLPTEKVCFERFQVPSDTADQDTGR